MLAVIGGDGTDDLRGVEARADARRVGAVGDRPHQQAEIEGAGLVRLAQRHQRLQVVQSLTMVAAQARPARAQAVEGRFAAEIEGELGAGDNRLRGLSRRRLDDARGLDAGGLDSARSVYGAWRFRGAQWFGAAWSLHDARRLRDARGRQLREPEFLLRGRRRNLKAGFPLGLLWHDHRFLLARRRRRKRDRGAERHWGGGSDGVLIARNRGGRDERGRDRHVPVARLERRRRTPLLQLQAVRIRRRTPRHVLTVDRGRGSKIALGALELLPALRQALLLEQKLVDCLLQARHLVVAGAQRSRLDRRLGRIRAHGGERREEGG